MLLQLCLTWILALGVFQDQGASVQARFALEPVEVEVGEPFQLSLLVEHPSSESVFDITLNELELDDSWVLFGMEHATALPLAHSPGRSVTRWNWQIASLDAGERRLLGELVSLVDDERIGALDLSQTSVQVHSLLAEGEDAPRPLRGLPAGFGHLPTTGLGFWQRAWPGALAVGVLLLGWLVWRLTRRPVAASAPQHLAPLAELEQLRAQPVTEMAALRARHFELTHLVRRAADEKRGQTKTGLTDEEWLSDVEAALESQSDPAASAGLASDLKRYLEQAQAIKYARADASEWTLEEFHASTRALLETLASQSWPKIEQGQRSPC